MRCLTGMWSYTGAGIALRWLPAGRGTRGWQDAGCERALPSMAESQMFCECSRMPSTPSTNKFRNRNMSDAARSGLLMTVYCGGCRRTVHYWAVDLVQVVGAFHEAHVAPWPCSRCRSMEYMTMRGRIPAASELQGLTVRRPVRQIVKWIWRDEPA